MNQKPCQFYSFLQAVRGNWRNALFIRCSGSLCPMIRQASCEGFLMAADASCQPIFLSVQTVRKLSGEAVDPEECSAILECRSFRTAYTKFLEWHTSSDHVCPFLQLCPDRDTASGGGKTGRGRLGTAFISAPVAGDYVVENGTERLGRQSYSG